MKFLVGTQIILEEYLALRKQSHLLYKLVRGGDWGKLYIEFTTGV